jgi:signal peptidase
MSRLPSRAQAAAVLLTLVLVAIVVPFVVFAVPQTIGADESYVVLSGSMEPTLSPGDVVIVDASAPIAVGDVITYTTGSDAVPTTHRVTVVLPDGYQTKGDANENVDQGVVAAESVIGRVVVTVPLVGHILLWTNTGGGFLALVVLPFVALGLSELLAWARDPAPAHETSEEPSAVGSTVAVAAIDLKFAALAMGLLFAYAAWNVYREVLALAAPSPISVGALTAGLLGLVLAAWVSVGAWRQSRAALTVEPASRTDGGEPGGEEDA